MLHHCKTLLQNRYYPSRVNDVWLVAFFFFFTYIQISCKSLEEKEGKSMQSRGLDSKGFLGKKCTQIQAILSLGLHSCSMYLQGSSPKPEYRLHISIATTWVTSLLLHYISVHELSICIWAPSTNA